MKNTSILVLIFIGLVIIALTFMPRSKVEAPDTEQDAGIASSTATTTYTLGEEPSDKSVSNPPAGDLSAKLSNAKFGLVSVNGIPASAEVRAAAGVTFGLKFGEISAKFCNGMGGTFAMKDFVMRAQLVGTQMYCESPAGLMDAEIQFGSMLNDGATVDLKGTTLRLTAKAETGASASGGPAIRTMVFQKQP